MTRLNLISAPTHTSTRGRWRAATASALALGMTLGLMGPVAAYAAAPDAGDADSGNTAADLRAVVQPSAAANTGRVVDFAMNSLWANESWKFGDAPLSIPIGLDTRSLSLDVNRAPLAPVTCEFGQEDELAPIITFTEDEWASDQPKTVPLPAAQRGVFYLRCTSGTDGQQHWQLTWVLQSRGGNVADVVVLTDDAKARTFSLITNLYDTLGAPSRVSAGDTVRISGAPGTWPANERARVSLFSGGGPGSNESFTVGGVSTSADGSRVEFVMPTPPTPDYFFEDASFIVTSSAYLSGPPRSSAVTEWNAPLAYVTRTDPPAQANPTVALTLPSRYALSIRRLTATATVSNADGMPPTGIVYFAVNGKQVGSAPVASGGGARFTLPKLAKGQYSVTATFTPTTGAPSVKSAGAWLRVVL